MSTNNELDTLYREIEAGIQLAKCRQCGCMRDMLHTLATQFPPFGSEEASALARSAVGWARQMRVVRYACLGCEHCYPAAAQNALALAFPYIDLTALECGLTMNASGWPPVVGEYVVLDQQASIAVVTLASLELPQALAQRKPSGLAIVGKLETENIGVDKIIKNVISSSSIRHIIVAGKESAGHASGSTLLALSANGVDADGRVIGSPGKRPILRNVAADEIASFRAQVTVIDMIGCEDLDELCSRVEELAKLAVATCRCAHCADTPSPVADRADEPIPLLAAEEGQPVVMDKAGYFVILPLPERETISIEHYGYDNRLLHAIEGGSVRSLYTTIISQGWVTELSHAAYLGKELQKAELSLVYGFKYVQDAA